MVGVVLPNTPIAFDFWKPSPGVKLFFLSHLHADHTVGLSPSWRHGTIYCSPVTRLLLLEKFSVDDELVEVIELEQPTLVYLDAERRETMTVTAFDANHCPGAVIFLLEGYFGRVLYTGDFRFSPRMTNPAESLLGRLLALGRLHVDILYLDNTYCDPKFVFPPREEGVQQVIDIIERFPDHRVMIGIDTLGKEELLEAVALRLQRWIAVSEQRLNAIRLLDMANVFTDRSDESKIWVVNKKEVTMDRVRAWNREYPTIAILPSGQCQNPLVVGAGRAASAHLGGSGSLDPSALLFRVPYSLHSSFDEMRQFVQFVRPLTLVPIVPERYADLYHHFGSLLRSPGSSAAAAAAAAAAASGPPMASVAIPATVLAFMKSPCARLGQRANVVDAALAPSSLIAGAEEASSPGVWSNVPCKTSGTTLEVERQLLSKHPKFLRPPRHQRKTARGRIFSLSSTGSARARALDGAEDCVAEVPAASTRRGCGPEAGESIVLVDEESGFSTSSGTERRPGPDNDQALVTQQQSSWASAVGCIPIDVESLSDSEDVVLSAPSKTGALVRRPTRVDVSDERRSASSLGTELTPSLDSIETRPVDEDLRALLEALAEGAGSASLEPGEVLVTAARPLLLSSFSSSTSSSAESSRRKVLKSWAGGRQAAFRPYPPVKPLEEGLRKRRTGCFATRESPSAEGASEQGREEADFVEDAGCDNSQLLDLLVALQNEA